MTVCDRCGRPINNNPFSAVVFSKVYITVQKTLFDNKQCDLCKDCERAIADFVFVERLRDDIGIGLGGGKDD